MSAIRNFTVVTDYTELPNAKLWVDKGKVRGQRIFRLKNYDNIVNFLAALAGGFETTSGTITYFPPHQFRSDVLLWCQGVETEGIGVPGRSGGNETFDGGARVTATYETLDYDPRTRGSGSGTNQPPGVYITESRSTGGQMIELQKFDASNAAVWKFHSGANLDNTTPALTKVEPQGEYTLTFHYLPSFKPDTINGLIGKVNNAQFPVKSSLGGFISGTLLFLGDQTEREFTADGSTIAFTMTLRFAYNPNGWNYAYDPVTKAFVLIELIADSSKHPYEYADFSPLLT